jgi:hypothetical protein
VITLPQIHHVNDVECDCHPVALLPTGSFVKLPEDGGHFREIFACGPDGRYVEPVRWSTPALSHNDVLGAALRCIPGCWVYRSPQSKTWGFER